MLDGITNSILVAAGVLTIAASMDFWKSQRKDITTKTVFFLGVIVSVWNLAAGFMGLIKIDIVRDILRYVILLGTLSYLTMEFWLIVKLVKPRKRTVLPIFCSIVVFDIVDLIFFGSGANYIYFEQGIMMHYQIIPSYRVAIHLGYCLFLMLLYGHLTVFYGSKLNFARDRKLAWMIYLSNAIIVLAAIPSIFLPLLGITSYPSSSLGAMLSFIMITQAVVRNNTYSISIRNLSEYIYHSANAGFMVFSPEHKLVNINDYALRLLEADKACLEQYQDHGEDLIGLSMQELQDLYEQAREGKEVSVKKNIGEGRKVFEICPSVIKDSYGDPYCMILTLHDLTREEEMMAEVLRADEAKNHFLANMSHEVRTPINAVLGMNEMIQRESKDEVISGYANDIEHAGRSLLSIINDVLDFSKIDSGNLKIVDSNYELLSLVSECHNAIVYRASSKGLQLNLECENDTPCLLCGDAVRVRQVISNVLTNAVKYTHVGYITTRVSHEMIDESNMMLIVSVTDTGCGIKEEDIPYLFTTFMRLDESNNRSIEGAGLGLSLTKKILDMMNGEISVSTVYGKGSTFVVRIPQKIIGNKTIGDMKERFAASQKRREEAKNQQNGFVAPNARVLVVDDVPMNLKVFQSLLRKTQIHIDTAESGAESLELMMKNTYDVIFMDHMMPEMDGIEVFHRLKGMKDNPNLNTPVIMLTANAVVGVEDEYLKEGFTAYMPKPIQPQKLENLIVELLPKELVKGL